MSDRALRDEIEQLEMQVKSLRAELAAFDVARRVERETAALNAELEALEARSLIAAHAPEPLRRELKQLGDELSRAAASLKEARRAVDRLSIPKTGELTARELQIEGCLPVLALLGASACWWWLS